MQTAIELDTLHNWYSQYEVFKIHADPLSLFPWRIANHYNVEGYQFVAVVIKKIGCRLFYASINWMKWKIFIKNIFLYMFYR